MLDAPIFCGGRLSGVLCIEHVGDVRHWDLAEISYVAAVADCISTINEHVMWERAHQKSEFLEQFDSLTGLFNRFAFQQQTERDIRDAPLQSHLMAIVGLDNFTGVNDKFGTLQADQVLRNLAARFKNMPAGKDCLIARLGGDLFGFWLCNVSNPNQVESLLVEIQQALQEPVQTDEGNLIRVIGTVGVFSFPYEGEGIPDPISGAEIAMLNAKKEAVGSIGYFSTRWYQQLHEKQQQITDLVLAFDTEQFTAFYQPILTKRAGTAIGLEALVRWNHPTKGLLFPDQFLPLATELGLMKRLGDFMLRQACSAARRLLDDGFTLEWVSVNLSADHLYSPTLITDVSNLLGEFNLLGKHLELEIVEELIGRDSELVLSQLNGLADLGVKLSIDDFGTGYSSLSRLKHLPVTKLKIDKSFVDGLPNSKDDQSIVRSIVGLAKALQLNLAAEGIETKEQADWLLNESVEYLQGFLYAKPMSFEALQSVLSSGSFDTIAPFTPATV
jgi:diguanylate cyclase (GGDEF)-like protein